MLQPRQLRTYRSRRRDAAAASKRRDGLRCCRGSRGWQGGGNVVVLNPYKHNNDRQSSLVFILD